MTLPRADKVAVVTGGSAGLGRAIVRELADRGFDVAVLARGPDGVAAAARDVRRRGRRGLGLPCDVADAAAVEKAAERIEQELGPIDLWVNNVMVGVFAEFLDVRPEEYERVTAVTYLGVVNGTRAALRRMRPRDAGHVIQVGSALAYRGIPLQAAYCGAKHAIVGMTESIITELLHDKSAVHISMVHMPALNTPQFSWVRSRLPKPARPVAPIYQPEVGARAVAHVAEHPRRNTWVAAPTTATILGNRFAGGLLDRYLGRTGVKAQQEQDGKATSIGDNLFDPVPGDHGAHGSFDDEAHEHSPVTWLGVRHGAAAAGAATALGLSLTSARLRRRRRRSAAAGRRRSR